MYKKLGYYSTHGYLSVTNFMHLTTQTLQCDFKCKTCLVKYEYDHRSLTVHVKSLTTPSLDMKKKRI